MTKRSRKVRSSKSSSSKQKIKPRVAKKRARKKKKRTSTLSRFPIFSNRVLVKALSVAAFAMFVVTLAYGLYLDRQISSEFVGQPWQYPARVYARPVELYAGKKLTVDELEQHLNALGYANVRQPVAPGQYARRTQRLRLITRATTHHQHTTSATAIDLVFSNESIAQMKDGHGDLLPFATIDPLLIGSILPKNGQDRTVIGADEVPSLLSAALIAVEDRNFRRHWGIDPRGILRAAWANIRSASVEQGGSTITQQLVKSHFLSNQRTWRRKFKEALMAIALDARMSKEDIMLAYINEIYLGQEGTRAIHGFDLASRFYFGRELTQLETHQMATLVGIVKGPSLYNPRYQPERALERRNQVLQILIDESVLSEEAGLHAMQSPLDVLDSSRANKSRYSAFMSMVKRQLLQDYDHHSLTSAGLTIHTTLDVIVQNRSALLLGQSVSEIERSVAIEFGILQGAAAIVSPDTGELIALIAGRDDKVDGFNRALDMRRPIGSLVKPIVYLAALQSGQWDLDDRVSNRPVSVTLDNGEQWHPKNFNDAYTEEETLFRSLAQSHNVATVKIGQSIGMNSVIDLLHRLGFARSIDPYPSLLLGAIDMSPFEVAQIYLGLASNGFVTPIRVVSSVVDDQGNELKRYPLKFTEQLDALSVFQVVEVMKLVASHGTGKTLGSRLPQSMQVAVKTGSTNQLRDSWFAGFSQDVIAVVWVGADDNRPIGLTGAQAALPVWADLMGQIARQGLGTVPPVPLDWRPFDYLTGAPATGCEDAILIPLRQRSLSERTGFSCAPPR